MWPVENFGELLNDTFFPENTTTIQRTLNTISLDFPKKKLLLIRPYHCTVGRTGYFVDVVMYIFKTARDI